MNEREGILDIIIKRRKEAREIGRILHPEPLITELRKKKKLEPKLLVVKRAMEFAENVAKMIRAPETWESAVASNIVGNVLTIFFGK